MSGQQQISSRLGGALTKLPVQWLEGKDEIATVFSSKLCVFSSKTGQIVKGVDMNIDCNKTNICAFRVNPQKQFEEAYVLDTSGKLTGIDLRSQLIFKEQQIEGIEGITAAFFSEDAMKIFILDNKTQLFSYKIAKNSLKIIASINRQNQEQQQQNQLAFLVLTSAQNYAIVASGKTILLIDIEDKKIFRTILHPRNVTAISTSNSTIAIGDDMGKITYYHHAFEQTDFTSSSVHWHSQAVKSLAFNCDASLLFSGGEEGVLIVWHQLEDKRDFYPRLGSEIVQISVSPGNEVVACSLLENSIQFLKISNFETSFAVQGFTNPTAYPSSNSLSKQSVFLKRIHQSEDTHLICMNSLPGRIQFISLFDERKVKEIDIIARNLTSRSGSYLPDPATVTAVAFDKTWKHMATITQRSSEEISLSALKFWHETSTLTYEANTRIEAPHGTHTFDVIAFFSKKSHETKFLTFGSDNKFKVWHQQARKVPDSKTGEGKIHEYFWNCEMEGSYKNKKIIGIQHCYDADDNDILGVIVEDVFLKWNLSSKVIEKSVKLQLKGDLIRFECSEQCEVLYVLNEQSLTILNSESGAVLFKLEMDQFLDLAIDRSSNQLSVLAVSPEFKSSVVVTFSTKDFSVIQAYTLPNTLNRLLYSHTLTNQVLLGLDEQMNFFIIADKNIESQKVKKYLSETESTENGTLNGQEATEAEQLKNSAYLAQPIKQQVSYSQKYQASLSYMFRHDFRGVADFYSEKSHLIPPSTLVFSQFFDSLMIKNNQNKTQNNLTAHDPNNSTKMEVESDNSSDVDDDDDEDAITFEKQGQKEDIIINSSNNKDINNNNTNSNSQGVSDKWIKDTHKYIENIFTVDQN